MGFDAAHRFEVTPSRVSYKAAVVRFVLVSFLTVYSFVLVELLILDLGQYHKLHIQINDIMISFLDLTFPSPWMLAAFQRRPCCVFMGR